jgi:hypothetical protein
MRIGNVRIPKSDLQDRFTIELPVISVDESDIHLGMIPVTHKSGVRLREVIHRFARYIQRENGYDFPPYTVYEPLSAKDKAYLLLGNSPHGFGKEQPVGVVVFERKSILSDYDHSPLAADRWWLLWTWVHPYWRGEHAPAEIGALQRAWPDLKQEFGDFWVQRPLSKAMKKFLEKQEHKAAQEAA